MEIRSTHVNGLAGGRCSFFLLLEWTVTAVSCKLSAAYFLTVCENAVTPVTHNQTQTL